MIVQKVLMVVWHPTFCLWDLLLVILLSLGC